MEQISFEEKKRLHELEVQKNVELAKDPSNYCTYLTEISKFDSEISLYSARRIGRDHIKKNKPCQDYCMTHAVNKGHIIAVSDGVSACLRSDKGSQFACEAAIEAVSRIDAETNSEAVFTDELCEPSFRKLLLNCWLDLLKNDIMIADEKKQVNMDDVRLYGATLSMAVITENYIVTLSLGDGQILLYNPVDAMRVRWHLQDKESAPNALCYADCYEDGFIVHKHNRRDYRGVLISTDGIYDRLMNCVGFYSYARQITERFEANGEPLQPFCFLEKTSKGERWIDLWANLTFDDCSIVLAVDHRFNSTVAADAVASLSNGYCVTELRTRANGLSLYAMIKDEKKYLALVKEGKLEDIKQLRKQIEDLKLTTAKILQPERQYEENGAAIAIYPDIPYYTPAGCFAVGKLKERAEAKYGLNASGFALKVLRALEHCDDELRQKGFCLNNNAGFLSFLTKEGLALMPEAISSVKEVKKSGLLWQMFDNQIGTLSCGELMRPVFSCGYNSSGPNILNPCKEPSDNLCYVKKEADGKYLLVNSGKDDWKLADGKKVKPGNSVPLTDGLSFEIPDTKQKAINVKYKERKKHS